MGEAPGFVELTTARSAALFRTALLLTGDWHLAEDLGQEMLRRLYLHWRRVVRADAGQGGLPSVARDRERGGVATAVARHALDQRAAALPHVVRLPDPPALLHVVRAFGAALAAALQRSVVPRPTPGLRSDAPPYRVGPLLHGL